MNTTENNKLIAEFMGYKLVRCNSGFAWDIGKSIPSKDHLLPIQGVLHTGRELKFHNSWDWLMPVVEKIWDCIGNRESLFYFTNDDCNIVKVSNGLDNKKDCYNAVVEFIKWYNKNKKS